MALAKKKKDQGNALFKSGENGPAAQAYKEGADLLKDMEGATEEQLQESGPLRVALLANLAAAYLKLNENGKAAEACQLVYVLFIVSCCVERERERDRGKRRELTGSLMQCMVLNRHWNFNQGM